MKTYRLPGALLGLILAAGWFAACQKESSAGSKNADPVVATDRVNGGSAVFPPNAHPHGKSIAEWTEDWWAVHFSYDCATLPFTHPENALFYQTGPVYFMAGISTYGGSADVTVPRHKAVLFPLVNFINDYPCPDPTFEPGPDQTLEEFLTEGAAGLENIVSNLSVTIDGVAVPNPENYFFLTDLFYFTGNPDLASCADACITGSSQPAVAAGYYMMLKPMSPGEHTVHYTADIEQFNFLQSGTFNITVN